MLQHQTCLIDVNKTLPGKKSSWLNRCDATHNGKRNVKKPLRGDERTQRYHDLERERERERVKKICEELSMEIVGAEIGECPTLQIEAFTNAAKI